MTMSRFKKKYKVTRPFPLNRYGSIVLFLSFIFLLSSCGGSGGNTEPSNLYQLSGQITGPAQGGITVQVTEGDTPIITTVTDKNGHYSFTLTPGIYTIIPSLDNYVFTPQAETCLKFEGNTQVNFISSFKKYTLSGAIKGDIQAEGVLLKIEGYDITGSMVNTNITSTSDGSFKFSALYSGPYTITPTLEGYAFMPPFTEVVVTETSKIIDKAFEAHYLWNFQQWPYSIQNAVFSSPASASDGTIYVGCDDYSLYAFDSDGSLKWYYTTEDKIRSSPAIGPDETIYVGSDDQNLYALNPNGGLKWTYPTQGKIQSSPAIGPDGTIYVGSDDYNLYALNPNGGLKWSYSTQNKIQSSPAIGPDGTIYVGSDDYNLYALNPDSSLKWTYPTQDKIQSSPAIGPNGTIYVGSDDYKLYALNPDGSLKWSKATQNKIRSSPAIGPNGYIYVGSDDCCLYAFTSNSTLKWSYATQDKIQCSPALGGDGTIWVGSNDQRIYSLNADGSLKAIFNTQGTIQSSPAITNEDIVFIGSNDGNIYALPAHCQGMPQDCWPMFRKDNRHSAQSRQISLYTISGEISGDAVKGIMVKSKNKNNDDLVNETLTDAEGKFSLRAPNGDYTLTPTKSGYQFIPPYITMSVNEWPSPGHQFSSISLIGKQKWKLVTNDAIYSSAAIGPDETIYIGGYDKKLYAVKPNGKIYWAYPTEEGIFASPVVDPEEETIYIGSTDSYVYALDFQGNKKWRTLLGDKILSTAAIGLDGSVYIGCNDTCLYALNPANGEKIWSTHLTDIVSSPVIGPDGTIYVGAGSFTKNTGLFYALNPEDGSIKWTTAICILSRPAIGDDGIIYAGSVDAKIYALHPDTGIPEWSYTTGSKIYSCPVIGPDGIIYIGSDDTKMYALTPSGSLKWSTYTGGEVRSAAAVGPDCTIYIGSRDQYLYAFDPETGNQEWRFFTEEGVITSIPTVGTDGTIYIGNQEGLFYAIYGEGKPL